jgi:anti-sigma28 factor (negative regulator of flagellin synthesis)
MKIQNSSVIATNPLAANASAGAADSTTGTAAPNSDAVQLSRLGSALAEASVKIFANPSRIQTLSKSIQSGSYTVDPLQISRGIVNDALTA